MRSLIPDFRIGCGFSEGLQSSRDCYEGVSFSLRGIGCGVRGFFPNDNDCAVLLNFELWFETVQSKQDILIRTVFFSFLLALAQRTSRHDDYPCTCQFGFSMD